MVMIFRAFRGYEDDGSESHPKRKNSEIVLTEGDLGREVIYSSTQSFNRMCMSGSEHYGEASLKKDDHWRLDISKYIKFAAKYYEIGLVTVLDDYSHMMTVVTENCYTNAYANFVGKDAFYVLFNARPTLPSKDRRKIKIGFDEYGLLVDNQSIIVWDAERYTDAVPADFTIWGIKQEVPKGFSLSDDNLIGIRNGKTVFVH